MSASSVPPCPNSSALVEFLPNFLPVLIHFYLLSSVWYTWIRMKAGLACMEFCLTLWPLGKVLHQTFSHLIPIHPFTFSPYPVLTGLFYFCLLVSSLSPALALAVLHGTRLLTPPGQGLYLFCPPLWACDLEKGVARSTVYTWLKLDPWTSPSEKCFPFSSTWTKSSQL